MTIWGRLSYFFPMLHALASMACVINFIRNPALVSFAITIFCIYLVPPLLFRLYSLKYPIKQRRWIINRSGRCEWWIGHQLQMVYAAVPMLEAFLRLVPGVYSAWLRLWGSSIGKRVYWTPRVEIIDRNMLRVGDDVIFGHRVACNAHAITKKDNGDLVLFVRPINIESGVLIGALSRIGPGVRIPAGVAVPYDTEYRFSYTSPTTDALKLPFSGDGDGPLVADGITDTHFDSSSAATVASKKRNEAPLEAEFSHA